MRLPAGETVRTKVPSTVHDQSIGVNNGITKAREILENQYGWNGEFEFTHRGTTTATNAVLESKGARSSGLIVTSGHKDILALRRSQIPGGLGAWINFKPPEPVVPLERTVQCSERVSAIGNWSRRLIKKNYWQTSPILSAKTLSRLPSAC